MAINTTKTAVMRIPLVLEMMMKRNSECETPAIGTEEFKVWWESQYAPAESHNIKPITMNDTDTTPTSNIEVVEGTSLELNTMFYELEQEAFEEGEVTIGK